MMVRNACHMHLTLLIECSVRKCLRRRVAYRSLNLTLDVWRVTFILQMMLLAKVTENKRT